MTAYDHDQHIPSPSLIPNNKLETYRQRRTASSRLQLSDGFYVRRAPASAEDTMVPKDDHGPVPYKIEPSFTHSSSYTMREPEYDDPLAPRFDRFIDSFRRDPNSTFSAASHLEDPSRQLPMHNGSHYYDLHLATLENAHIGLSRRLKGRHLQMIAIGGSIGMLKSRACGQLAG